MIRIEREGRRVVCERGMQSWIMQGEAEDGPARKKDCSFQVYGYTTAWGYRRQITKRIVLYR
jgi:hypothetical protein